MLVAAVGQTVYGYLARMCGDSYRLDPLKRLHKALHRVHSVQFLNGHMICKVECSNDLQLLPTIY